MYIGMSCFKGSSEQMLYLFYVVSFQLELYILYNAAGVESQEWIYALLCLMMCGHFVCSLFFFFHDVLVVYLPKTVPLPTPELISNFMNGEPFLACSVPSCTVFAISVALCFLPQNVYERTSRMQASYCLGWIWEGSYQWGILGNLWIYDADNA